MAAPSPSPSGVGGADGTVVTAAVVVGITVAAVLDKGAFHSAESLPVALACAAVVAIVLVRGVDRRAVAVAVTTGSLAAWWLADAAVRDRPAAFLPFGASMLGFLAAYLAMRALGPGHRRVGASVALAIGAISAAVGLVAVALRVFPLAERAQDLWRVSTTLTYSNAAGLLFAVTLLLGLSLVRDNRLARVGVSLCVAGLVATESRGAVLAALVALLVVPARQCRSGLGPLVAGVAAGLVAVAMSTGNAARPLIIVAVAVAAAAAGLLPPWTGRGGFEFRQIVRPPGLVVVGLLLVALVAAGVALGSPVERRLNQDRVPEWSAAVEEWRSAPLLGVGPDKPLTLKAATETTAPFAQSEGLQLLADGGLLAVALLVAAGVALAADIRRRDVLTSCATAALTAFALAGMVDFDWHLPAIGLVGGWAAGLAARPPGQAVGPAALSSGGEATV